MTFASIASTGLITIPSGIWERWNPTKNLFGMTVSPDSGSHANSWPSIRTETGTLSRSVNDGDTTSPSPCFVRSCVDFKRSILVPDLRDLLKIHWQKLSDR